VFLFACSKKADMVSSEPDEALPAEVAAQPA